METERKYDFSISYASPDTSFVEQVVQALKGRGLSVFYAPDEQADIIGRNLIDYLSDVYLAKAKFCLVFISRHYAERPWPDKVERPAVQARAFEQQDRYIIPIRLDDTSVPGILSTTADIRDATPKQIADIAVSVLLRDEAPTAVSDEHYTGERLIVRINSFTELDVDLLKKSFKPFSSWVAGNAHMIPVQLYLPRFFMETVEYYENILMSDKYQDINPETRKPFTDFVTSIRNDVFKEILSVPSAILIPSQPDDGSSLILTDKAVDLIRRYILAKVVALARCLVSYQLKGYAGPKWARQFADCDTLWSPRILGGLPWLCRAEGLELHMWLDADITEWTGHFSRVRIKLPSKMVLGKHNEGFSPEEVLHFVAPQLVERQLQKISPYLLHDAFHYAQRMKVTKRNEKIIECHHFHELILSNFNWREALPAIESLRDEIVAKRNAGVITTIDAIMLMHKAEYIIDRPEVFESAFKVLYAGAN
ncbi:MAG: TIR domain-containing protein [Gammaproteobacteria bacterium]|nr:TIR domain-containing protein [Gammaproteobacteria bacterium]